MKFKFLFVCALLFSNCLLAATPSIPVSKEIKTWEKSLSQSINGERAKSQLAPLLLTERLSALAKKHSQDMAEGKVSFGHGGFDKRADSILKEKKHSKFGENVAYSYLVKDHLKTAVTGWMNSEGHRKNILGDYNETGIGIVFSKEGYCYLTQLFAKRK